MLMMIANATDNDKTHGALTITLLKQSKARAESERKKNQRLSTNGEKNENQAIATHKYFGVW